MPMPLARRLFVTFCAAGLISAQNAPQKQLTARELFYAAAQMPAPKPDPAKAPPKAAPIRSTKTPPKPVEIATSDSKPSQSRPPSGAPTSGEIVLKTAPQTAPMPVSAEPPIGIRYTVLKLASDNTPTEVPADTVFHSGDRIRFTIEPNAPGYLYIVNQGSDGTWQSMFPSADIDQGSNRVEGWHPYTMPPQSRLMFDSTAGTEHLFIVFARQPEPDLENLIYSLKAGGKRAAKPEDSAIKPGALSPMDRTLVMAVNISNPLIDRLRQANSRNLIVEKIDPNTPGDKKETAVYVVNPSGSADSRVVADLHLVHQ
jgi:hypothetical protein